jgi:hypothetical protein
LWSGSVAACGIEEPGADDPARGVAETTQAVQTSAAWFRDTSTLRGSPTDWDPNRGKAGCASDEAITGLSVDLGDHQGRNALCGSDALTRFTGQPRETILFDGVDQWHAHRNGDWAQNFWKLECERGEYVSAVSEDAAQYAGDNHFHGLQCAQGSNLDRYESCTARAFAGGDSRGATASGDWDFGASKGECEVNEYVVGVSISTDTRGPNSILCCGGHNVGLYKDINYTGVPVPGLGDSPAQRSHDRE